MNDTALHFGLGAATMADLRIVLFGQMGKSKLLVKVLANQVVYVIYEP